MGSSQDAIRATKPTKSAPTAKRPSAEKADAGALSPWWKTLSPRKWLARSKAALAKTRGQLGARAKVAAPAAPGFFWTRAWRVFSLVRAAVLLGLIVWVALLSYTVRGVREQAERSVTGDDLNALKKNLSPRLTQLETDNKTRKNQVVEADRKADKAMTEAVEVKSDLKTLKNRVDKFEQGEPGNAKAEEQVKKLANEVATLREQIKSHKADLTKKIEDHKAELANTVEADRKLREKLEAMTKKARTELEAAQGAANKEKDLRDKTEQKLAQATTSLDTERKKVSDTQKELSRSRPNPTDVLVVAMHSGNLSLGNHIDDILKLVHPKKRTTAPNCRVGLLLLEGDTSDLVLPLRDLGPDELKEADDRLNRLRGGSELATDRLDSAILPVERAFADSRSARPNDLLGAAAGALASQALAPGTVRRCVILASTKCTPDTSDKLVERWKGIDVQIILIGSDSRRGDLNERQLLEWHRFGRACGGSVTLVAAKEKPEEPDGVLRAQIRSLLIQATQPVYSVTKTP